VCVCQDGEAVDSEIVCVREKECAREGEREREIVAVCDGEAINEEDVCVCVRERAKYEENRTTR